MGLSARNLVLIGDQMQLGQPSQVVQPGESGLSCLEYVLQGYATVPEHLGIFLGVSRRLNPAVCRFISDAIYDGRLTNLPETERHRVFRSAGTMLVPAEAGVVFVPVEHDGCDQASNEEVETIARIVEGLLGRTVTGTAGPGRWRLTTYSSSPPTTCRCAGSSTASARGRASAPWTSSRARKRRS
jgi:uncharacterized protein